VRQGSVDWGCQCPENERNSPYTLDALPGYSHSNCLCTVVAQLQNQDEFNERVQRWGRGEPDAGLDQWFTEVYLPEAA
jgi:hypothetical protein